MRLIELTDRLVELTGARVEERLARLLLKQAAELGRPERGGVFLPLAPLAPGARRSRRHDASRRRSG